MTAAELAHRADAHPFASRSDLLTVLAVLTVGAVAGAVRGLLTMGRAG